MLCRQETAPQRMERKTVGQPSLQKRNWESFLSREVQLFPAQVSKQVVFEPYSQLQFSIQYVFHISSHVCASVLCSSNGIWIDGGIYCEGWRAMNILHAFHFSFKRFLCWDLRHAWVEGLHGDSRRSARCLCSNACTSKKIEHSHICVTHVDAGWCHVLTTLDCCGVFQPLVVTLSAEGLNGCILYEVFLSKEVPWFFIFFVRRSSWLRYFIFIFGPLPFGKRQDVKPWSDLKPVKDDEPVGFELETDSLEVKAKSRAAVTCSVSFVSNSLDLIPHNGLECLCGSYERYHASFSLCLYLTLAPLHLFSQ